MEKPAINTLCLLIAYTGCVVSEALELKKQNFDFAGEAVMFNNIHSNVKNEIRYVPLPLTVLKVLDQTHGIRIAKIGPKSAGSELLWPIHRVTAWRQISTVMKEAGIEESQANPRVLRHTFVIRCKKAGYSKLAVQNWLGLAKLPAVYEHMF